MDWGRGRTRGKDGTSDDASRVVNHGEDHRGRRGGGSRHIFVSMMKNLEGENKKKLMGALNDMDVIALDIHGL